MILSYLLAAVILTAPLCAQSWSDLGSGSQLNNVAPVNCVNSTPPSYCAGVTFPYHDNFLGVMNAWSSAVARTKTGSEQLLIFGGGHVITFDNSVYAVNLNVSPATVSALTVPSIPTGSGSPVTSANITCTSPNADGTPLSMHTYGQIVYLPVADKMFFWADGAGNFCATSGTRHVWEFDPVAKTWVDQMPTGVGGFDIYAGGDAEYAFCTLDNSFAITSDESVICEWGNNDMLVRYDATANTWTRLTTFGSATYPQSPTVAIDPYRKLMLVFGPQNADGTGGLKLFKVDISNTSYAATDFSSSLQGCSALNVAYPGIVFDPYTRNFMAYPGVGNTVYELNPDTGICQGFTAGGGPTATVGEGVFGHWAYFPSLGKFASVTLVGSDAFTWSEPTPGLGASTTVTCIDRDGDGYGTGPGCTGPDADDLDSAVQTAAQGITKWGSLSAFLLHLGYAPLRTWYIATTGNDSTCVSSGAPVGIGSPCLTFTPVGANLLAGDMVIYRSGTYTEAARFTPSVNGTAANPIIGMAYPGETVIIDTTATSDSDVSIIDESYVIVDGLKLTRGLDNGCISGGTSTYGLSSNTFHDVVIRHVEAYSCIWGFIASGLDNVTIEDSVMHDNTANGGQHGIYIGAKGNALASNDTIHRVISYNNGYTGIQVNGNVAGLVEDQNISYGNLIADYSWENGVHNSFFRSNLAMSWGGGGLVISEYNGNEGLSICGAGGMSLCVCTPTPNLGATCAHDQTGNLIENYTAYGTTNTSDGSSAVNGPAINVSQQSNCTTATCLAANLGNNTFSNLVLAANTDGSGHYQPVVYNQGSPSTFLSSSTYTSMLAWDNDSTHSANVIGWGPGAGFGWAGYTCSSATSVTTLSGCTNSSPLFSAAAPSYYSNPSLFNLRVGAGSPALAFGSVASLPSFDVLGAPFLTAPTSVAPAAGAYAEAGGSPPVITSSSTLTAATQYLAYTWTFTATGSPPITWSVISGAPPTGLSLNSTTGVLSGIPTSAAGSYTWTIQASNGLTPATQNDSLTLNPVCVLSYPSGALPAGKLGIPYSTTIPTAGCASPVFSVSAGSLPSGLSLNTTTGVISGTPTGPGLSVFTISVADANGNPSDVYQITIVPGPGVFSVTTGPGFLIR